MVIDHDQLMMMMMMMLLLMTMIMMTINAMLPGRPWTADQQWNQVQTSTSLCQWSVLLPHIKHLKANWFDEFQCHTWELHCWKSVKRSIPPLRQLSPSFFVETFWAK